MTSDPRGLRADAPLLDAYLTFLEVAPTPFTIPGHKQRLDLVGSVVAGDVPLYGGLDTVKVQRGVLADAEARAAQLWGADICRFSVGGSTHGNQALALSVGQPGDQVIVSRMLHRSLLLGLVLAGLVPIWLTARLNPTTGLPLPIDPQDVERLLRAHPAARAVFVTDSSYVGVHSDLRSIAALAHAHAHAHPHGIPLIVDAAWSGHYGFHPDLPRQALAQGADALVTSAHKTLPAYSQAALILARTTRLDAGRLDRAIEATHTTSPAGAILASIDASRALLARDGAGLLDGLIANCRYARDRLGAIPGVSVLDGPHIDPAKLVVLLSGTGADGNAIEADLAGAGMPVEMADRDCLVPMVTMADTRAHVQTLVDALAASIERHRRTLREVDESAWSFEVTTLMAPREAYFAPHETVQARAAIGRVCAELIAPYPPGIPALAPGEEITRAVLDRLLAVRDRGTRIAYAADPTLATLEVVAR